MFNTKVENSLFIVEIVVSVQPKWTHLLFPGILKLWPNLHKICIFEICILGCVFYMSVSHVCNINTRIRAQLQYTCQASAWPSSMANKDYNTQTPLHSRSPSYWPFTPELYHYIRTLTFHSLCEAHIQCFIPVTAKPCSLACSVNALFSDLLFTAIPMSLSLF